MTFPPDAVAFFVDLEANNTRDWWLAHKDRFDASVRDPMRSLLDALDDEFGPFHVFRMNRDVRFSNDKSPYKTAHAAMAETEGGSSHYVQISKDGLFAGGGMYHLAKDQLVRYRSAVDDARKGPALERALAAARDAGVPTVGGPEGDRLASAPRGYAKDHPRVELLRWKGVVAARELGSGKWLQTRAAVTKVADTWRRSAPLLAWLDRHVGPSELPPGR